MEEIEKGDSAMALMSDEITTILVMFLFPPLLILLGCPWLMSVLVSVFALAVDSVLRLLFSIK